jgi:hypothetical protein
MDRGAHCSLSLVVVELKRTDDGGHMELQAVRYAAMVSSMTFDQLVGAHAHFGRGTRSHSAEQSGNKRVHVEAGQLRQVFSPAQDGDSQEYSIHGQDYPDKGQTEGYVCELGKFAAA